MLRFNPNGVLSNFERLPSYARCQLYPLRHSGLCVYLSNQHAGRLRGISLPGRNKQQSISQYADDSSFMVREDKRYVDELVRLRNGRLQYWTLDQPFDILLISKWNGHLCNSHSAWNLLTWKHSWLYFYNLQKSHAWVLRAGNKAPSCHSISTTDSMTNRMRSLHS